MSRINTKAITWGVTATMFAVAFLLAYASMVGAAEEPLIDTGAAVDSKQCSACHPNLGSVDVPGVIFSHGNHLLMKCDTCHSRMPHRGGAAERIPMEVCAACHGLEHADQGVLARGDCEACHTPAFDLRPSSHVDDWAKEPHADYAKATGVNGCMMCHEAAKDCDECHADKAPAVRPMPQLYHPVIYPRPPGPSTPIDPKGGVSMSQCVYCHPDLDDSSLGRVIFSHSDHIARNYACESCHPKFPHGPGGTTRPDMLSCYRCHGLEHAALGEVATTDCDRCHPKDFELIPENHTKKFIKGEHKKTANSEPEYCAMCHAGSFCVGCHRGEKTSPNAPGKAIIPADHRKAEWQNEHGGRFLDGEGACGSCHTDASCKRCHETGMPHPVGWLTDHKPAPGVSNDDCDVCHTDRDSCQKCHHESVEQGQLVAANCTPCHDEMKQKPPTDIQNQGFATHAVHFDVSKTKGEPYVCDDCHIGYSTVGASQNHQDPSGTTSLAAAGHDVRLCYGCHGALDYQNRQIAPWPGVALCVRCHDDLDV